MDSDSEHLSGCKSNSGDSDFETVPTAAPSNSPTYPATSNADPSVPGPSQPVAGPSKLIAGPLKPFARHLKRSQCKQPETAPKFADYDNESDGDDPGIDFEAMDITSQDEKSSDDEELNIFNERYLEDDTFPPGDSIGLRERYEFDPEVKFYLHSGCTPYEVVMPEDLWNPNKTESLFGGFPKLLPYKAPRLSRPDTLIRQLIALGIEATRAKERWELYNRQNPRVGPELREWSKTESLVFPIALQPLIRVVFIRLVAWLRAKAMAPYIYAHWMTMAYILREALHLYATSERLIDTHDFSSPEFTPEDLVNQVKKSKLQVIELSYVCEELKDWHALSTVFMNTLRGNWLVRRIPNLGEIINIVEGTQDWNKATYALGVKQAENRPKKWKQLLDIPFQPSQDRRNYLFGCPTYNEQSSNLEEALEEARKMDPLMLVIEGVSNLENIISSSGETVSSDTLKLRSTPVSSPSPTVNPAPTVNPVPSVDSVPSIESAMKSPLTEAPSLPYLPVSPRQMTRPKPSSMQLSQSSLVDDPSPAVGPASAAKIGEVRPNLLVTLSPENTIGGAQSIAMEPAQAGAGMTNTSVTSTHLAPAPPSESGGNSGLETKLKTTSPHTLYSASSFDFDIDFASKSYIASYQASSQTKITT
ncbi:hypothetical protein RSAG8_07368, partial [Rhizoctonia solani AG-8 WAC10335]